MKPSLVNYSDSDDPDDGTVPAPKGRNLKRKRDGLADNAVPDLPPLPANFHDLYASTTRASSQDDPNMHGGRQRVIPHVEGNWPTHVYVEWHPSPTESSLLSNVVSGVNKAQHIEEPLVHSLLKSDLDAELPLHVSLSRPIVLLTEQRQPFAELLEQSILHSSTRPFGVSVQNLDWVGNQENTRWFLVLRVAKPNNDGLGILLRATNQAVESFGQPPLYSASRPRSSHAIRSRGTTRASRTMPGGRSRDRSQTDQELIDEDLSSHFHISIGWKLDPPSTDLIERTKSIRLGDIMALQIQINAAKIKSGNTITVISLPTKVEEGRGLIGS